MELLNDVALFVEGELVRVARGVETVGVAVFQRVERPLEAQAVAPSIARLLVGDEKVITGPEEVRVLVGEPLGCPIEALPEFEVQPLAATEEVDLLKAEPRSGPSPRAAEPRSRPGGPGVLGDHENIDASVLDALDLDAGVLDEGQGAKVPFRL